ncbi:ParA family protein [Kineococcus vitellinus]|uniref:ParA family protein n=1 Tax=Kineococcus vitellinus TaxID=2696565 RepID=UPI003B833E0B
MVVDEPVDDAPVLVPRDVPRGTTDVEGRLSEELEPSPVDVGPAPVPRETPRARVAERFPAPTETRIMTIANQKGGVGKTTTAVNLASALAAAGLKVLVLDLDPQGNASTALGIEHHSEVAGVYEVLVEGRPLIEVVQRCEEAPDLWCAPATVDLAGAEIELVSMVARESRLQRAVAKYLKAVERAGERRVDYVLIDCPPSLGLLTINAFVAAPEVLIPIQCEYYALEGLSQLLANIELIQEHLNPDLAVTTILLTMYDGRTRLAAQVVDEVRSHFGEQVLKTLVPRSVRISEAPSHGQTVMAYDPLSSGALAYLQAAREIAQRGVQEPPQAAEDAAVGAPSGAADPWARWTDGSVTRRGFASKEGGA